MATNYLSQERYEKLRRELEEFKTQGRQEIAERLKHAKDLGDLSENSEYQEARDEQARLERSIAEIESLLKDFSIIQKPAGGDTPSAVKVGSRVRVRKGTDEVFYTIVGSNEAQPAEGLISNESPIGRGLLGKKTGDEIMVMTPKGEVSYQILSID